MQGVHLKYSEGFRVGVGGAGVEHPPKLHHMAGFGQTLLRQVREGDRLYAFEHRVEEVIHRIAHRRFSSRWSLLELAALPLELGLGHLEDKTIPEIQIVELSVLRLFAALSDG